MKQNIYLIWLFLSAVLFAPISASAQITIGSTNPPSPFSLLYLDATEQQRGLHNARLNTVERDALVTPDSSQEYQDLAQGLLLFNTDNKCLEFWNGNRWVSLPIATVGAISGDAIVTAGDILTYSVQNTSGIIYDWIFPETWDIIAGQYSNEITVRVGGVSGYIVVTPRNTCGDVGTSRRLAVNVRGCPIRSTLSSGWLTFMCHNLGADTTLSIAEQRSHITADNRDSIVLGHLFQWGRRADGHQMRNSTASPLTNNGGALSGAQLDANGQPADDFIGMFLSGSILDHPTAGDWRTPADVTLWNSGTETAPVKTVNDPCPPGWRVPTRNEWNSITGTAATGLNNWEVFQITDADFSGTPGRFITPFGASSPTLFLPIGGGRAQAVLATLQPLTIANFWSSTANDNVSNWGFFLRGEQNNAMMHSISQQTGRIFGASVRCVLE